MSAPPGALRTHIACWHIRVSSPCRAARTSCQSEAEAVSVRAQRLLHAENAGRLRPHRMACILSQAEAVGMPCAALAAYSVQRPS